MILRGPLTPRRKGLLAVLALLLVGVGYLYWAGMAITAGIETRDMDWNGDGAVSRAEIAQSFYAVKAARTRDGNRTCTSFHWRGSDQPIRVDCRTEFTPGKPAP